MDVSDLYLAHEILLVTDDDRLNEDDWKHEGRTEESDTVL